MKQGISYGRQLGIWLTYDQADPGKKVLWELTMENETDLLLYDSDIPMEQVEKDIKEYTGSTIAKLGWSLRVLSSDEVYSAYLLE